LNAWNRFDAAFADLHRSNSGWPEQFDHILSMRIIALVSADMIAMYPSRNWSTIRSLPRDIGLHLAFPPLSLMPEEPDALRIETGIPVEHPSSRADILMPMPSAKWHRAHFLRLSFGLRPE